MQMTTQDIVKHQVGEKNFHSVYKGLHHLLSTNRYRMVRENNTLFLFEILEKGSCHVQMINADEPKKLLRNIGGALEAAKKANYTKIYFDSMNPQIVEYLHHLGLEVQRLNDHKFLVVL